MALLIGPQDDWASESEYSRHRDEQVRNNLERSMYIVTPIESRRASDVIAMEVRASQEAIKRISR